MKPTFPTSRSVRRNDHRTSGSRYNHAPVTDWSFQPSATPFGGGSASFRKGGVNTPLHPAFHTLSEGFFSAEAKKESRLEGALFAVIVALAAWPMVLAAQAALALMK